MTGNERLLIQFSERATKALESTAVGLKTIADCIEEIRLELKKKRFDDAADFATFEKGETK